MELAEGELARLLEETLANCLGYTAPREVLRTRRASQAVLARVEECLPGLPTQALDRDGTTLLHLSAGLGIAELTQRVLERRSDVSSIHRQFGTPLHLAAERGHQNVARLLLAEKADVQQAFATTEITALHVAAARGHVPVLHTLIEAGAGVNKANAAGATPLHCAVAKGHVEAITALLQSSADTNSICHDGKSPLHFAAYQSLVEPLQVLLEARASVNDTDAAGYTPLIFASREGHKEVVEVLLESMADVNILSSDCEGPLHAAADRGHSGIVVLLLSRQADVEARNGDGLTALDMVTIDENPAIAELLIDRGKVSSMRSVRTEMILMLDMNPAMWQHINILKIERVENGMQEDGSAEPYYKALQRGVENQGVPFVPGLHTRWVFHGSSAVDSIVSNPISGFQPLMSGTRGNALWGSGTYFARDAKYVYDGGFCSPGVDGSRQILLCLLMNGFVCLGDSEHKGVLPFRQGRHRYNASVDSLSNPEIFVTQSPGAAYPAYVITFS
ncbi:ANK1 [Symbiodinium sp. CCMP2592]|nr:ANK1 [Symbiodinium sp. CCMP2592]